MERAFRDRSEAGRRLARQLRAYQRDRNAMVLGLPRGGVPVAYEVARALQLPLDVLVVRKLGVPGHEEFAMGAIAPGGFRFVDWDVVEAIRLQESALKAVVAREEAELRRREQLYRGGSPPLAVMDRIVILVDDGLATGASMRVAVAALREKQPARVVVAVPVAAPSVCRGFRQIADEVVCAVTPVRLGAVGLWYQDFTQTSDDDVRHLLDRANEERFGLLMSASGPA